MKSICGINMQETEISVLERARRIRRRSLRMVHRARMGHPGGDLSCADILAVLYFHVLRLRPEQPQDPHRDRFVLSKGHASAALYAALAERSFFPPADLDTYMRPLSQLNGHPARTNGPRRPATN